MLFYGGYGVLKLVECTFDIAWQRNIDCAILVVPCHRETTVLGDGKISVDFILSEKYRHEVVGMLFTFVFEAKVTNKKSESDGEPLVCEQTRGVFGFMVSWGGKVINDALVVNNYGLGKAIHALLNFNNDVDLVSNR